MAELVTSQEIVDSAAFVQAIMHFAGGASLPLVPSIDNDKLLEEYRQLVTQYTKYCIEALSNRFVAELILNNLSSKNIIGLPVSRAGLSFSELYETISLLKTSANEIKVVIGLNVKNREETKPEMLTVLEQNAYAPTDPANAWFVTPDRINQGGILFTSHRNLEPNDLIVHPTFITPFVRGISTIFSEAQQRIIGQNALTQTSAVLRVQNIVSAFHHANQTLGHALEIPPGK